MRQRPLTSLLNTLVVALPLFRLAGDDVSREPTYRAQVEADWERQEKRRNRRSSDPRAIQDALHRAERLIDSLAREGGLPDSAEVSRRLEAFRQRIETRREFRSRSTGRSRSGGSEYPVGALSEIQRAELYRELRWFLRDVALRNPLLESRPVVFLKRRRFVCQMLHEYLAYYYDYGDIAGGGVYVLEEPGRSARVRDLIGARLPRGNFTTLSLSADARTIYFAYAPRAPEKPDYYSSERRSFHIYTMDSQGTNLRPLTNGPDDDFDPCPLPDGDIAFVSSRRGGFGRCHNPWEPLPTYTLFRMDANGARVEALSFHETNEWHPSVLADGRIVYSRWDYVDRSAANFHGLWVTRPDGTGASSLFGNYTRRINACFQPRAIPGSNRVVFVAGAHHANVGGSLVVLDPSRVGLDAKTGEDQLESLELLTPEVCFPEAPGWPGSYFHSPWPLSEDYYLVAFSFDPLPGMGPGVKRDTETGIYLFDRFGNLELLYRESGISAMYPIPLAPRKSPPVLPSRRDVGLGDEGELVLVNVRQSLLPWPESRPPRELRVFQVLPKSATHVANQPRLGYANAESARMLLGSVPVEADGSAYFRVPAGKPLYFQAVDANGRAVQGMRSVVYLQPGERRSCVGCHEHPGANPPAQDVLAVKRAPSRIRAGPEGSKPWSYPRLVQPVLDAHCVRCHHGDEAEGSVPPDLTGGPAGPFSRSYKGLQPYVRWYEWGGGIGGDVTRPGRMPADESRLTAILDDSDHAKSVHLSDGERRRIYLWLDGNAAFYGTYARAAQLAQQRGEGVPPPALQ